MYLFNYLYNFKIVHILCNADLRGDNRCQENVKNIHKEMKVIRNNI